MVYRPASGVRGRHARESHMRRLVKGACGAEADEDAMQAAMEARPDGFAAVDGEPEITTVAEEADRLGNARLMRRFKHVVMAYIIGRVLSVFLPAFGTDDPTSKTAAAVIAGTILWYLMRFLLMLALAWVFRIREQDTMYLPIGADEENATQLDTHVRTLTACATKTSAAAPPAVWAPRNAVRGACRSRWRACRWRVRPRRRRRATVGRARRHRASARPCSAPAPCSRQPGGPTARRRPGKRASSHWTTTRR